MYINSRRDKYIPRLVGGLAAEGSDDDREVIWQHGVSILDLTDVFFLIFFFFLNRFRCLVHIYI